jgi:hypothetical protein
MNLKFILYNYLWQLIFYFYIKFINIRINKLKNLIIFETNWTIIKGSLEFYNRLNKTYTLSYKYS